MAGERGPHPVEALRANQPSIWERFFRALDVRGPLPSDVLWASQLGIQQLDLTEPEFAFLSRENRYVFAVQIGAAVGFNSIAVIRNPDNSGVLVIVDRVRVFNANAGGQYVGLVTDTASIGSASSRIMGLDTRSDLSTTVARPIAVITTSNTAAVAFPAVAPQWQVNSTQNVELLDPKHPVVLRPGTALWVQVSAVNLSLDTQLYWRERAFSASEL